MKQQVKVFVILFIFIIHGQLFFSLHSSPLSIGTFSLNSPSLCLFLCFIYIFSFYFSQFYKLISHSIFPLNFLTLHSHTTCSLYFLTLFLSLLSYSTFTLYFYTTFLSLFFLLTFSVYFSFSNLTHNYVAPFSLSNLTSLFLFLLSQLNSYYN